MRKLGMHELNRISVEEYKKATKLPIVIILDNVRSLNNIGAIFRTADAFRIHSIYLCGITSTPPHKDIQKTALGATESVEWSYLKNTLDAVKILQAEGYLILGVEQVDKSCMLHQYSFEKEKKYALVFGHEVMGVSQEVINLCDACIEIPQIGTKHSFNISVSVGVVLWEVYKNFINMINPVKL